MLKRSLIAVIAALCLVFALAACGDNTATTGTTSVTTTAPSGSTLGGSTTAAGGAMSATTASGGAMSATTAAGGAMSATTAAGGAMSATTAAGGATSATTAPSGTMDATMGAGGTPGAGNSFGLDADVPQYTGAQMINLPPEALGTFSQAAGNFKNAKIALFKSSDSFDKIKAFYSDSLTKAGYTDMSTQMGTAMAGSGGTMAAGTAMTAAPGAGGMIGGMMSGMQTALFNKSNKIVVVLGLPTQALGAAASTLGIGPNDTVFEIVSGEQ